MALTLAEQVEQLKKQLAAHKRKESRVDAIEVDGKIIKLAEAAKEQDAAAAKADEALFVESMRGAGMTEAQAKAAYEGRPESTRGW